MSRPATLPATLPAAIVDTILDRLAVLFLSGAAGDLAAARHAATHMLLAYDPQTAAELRLAASIVSFSFHAIEALCQAATTDMPMTKILRLRGAAVSLSRESDKAERRLEQRQQARTGPAPQDTNQTATAEDVQPATNPPQPTPVAAIHPKTTQPDTTQPDSNPKAERAIALVEATRHSLDTSRNGTPIWSKSDQQRAAAQRITDNLRKNQAAHAAANQPTGAANPRSPLA